MPAEIYHLFAASVIFVGLDIPLIPVPAEKVEKPEAGVENIPNGTLVEQQPAKKPRGRPKGSVNAQKRINNASEGSVSAQKASAKLTKKKTDKAKSEKLRREVSIIDWFFMREI